MTPLHRVARHFYLLGALALVLQLSGCGGQSVAPVKSYNYYQKPRGETHTVNRGDTLYSIAWAYGIDHRDLAAYNGISEPYTIYPGQLLKVDLNGKRPAGARPAQGPGAPTRTLNSPDEGSAKAEPPAPAAEKKSPTARPSKPKTVAVSPPRKRAASTRGTKIKRWSWPAKGQIVTDFASSGGKGVDISGRLGQPVMAAADGRVVYAGGGLRGYGELIIVKHNKRFLSAYAHNNRILVKEGDEVKIGQRIAEMGSTGTDSVRLHFEIRRDGKPVNPVRYLPR